MFYRVLLSFTCVEEDASKAGLMYKLSHKLLESKKEDEAEAKTPVRPTARVLGCSLRNVSLSEKEERERKNCS